MAKVQINTDQKELAAEAAALTAEVLKLAINSNEQANWLLSGGIAPMEAYRLLASEYINKLDWDKIIVAIGDERCVPLDDPEANWAPISKDLLQVVNLPTSHQLHPNADQTAEKAATDYEQMLRTLVTSDDEAPHFDLVWLGIGEDGHTLSLFPGREEQANSQALVVAVHDSPKPPPDRISLTLKALRNTDAAIIMASGKGKAEIIKQVFGGDKSLPINRAVDVIEATGGKVTWLIDQAAASLIQ